MDIRYLSAGEVHEKLDMKSCIGIMKDIFMAFMMRMQKMPENCSGSRCMSIIIR